MASLESKLYYDKIKRETKRQRFVDGFTEIRTGLSSIFLGSQYLIMFIVKPHLYEPLFFLPILLPLCMILIILIEQKLKERITYPRTGYANFENHEINIRLNSSTSININSTAFILAFVLTSTILSFVISFIFVTSNSAFRDTIRFPLLPMLSILLSFGYCTLASRLKLMRFYFLSEVSVVLGMGLWLYWLYRGIDTTLWFEVAIFMIGIGITETSLGILVLRKYLRQNPLPIPRDN